MSYLNHNFVTNRVGGEGKGSKAGQGIYAESSTPKFPIGEKLEFADGRCFRYGYTAAAVNASLLVSQDLSATALVESDDIVIAASGDFSPAAGSSKLQITLASITANQYAGGYLHTVNDAGQGYTYRISSNTVGGQITDGSTFTLFDDVKVAITSATDVAITGNPYNGLVSATAATDMWVVGVCINAMDVSDKNFGWVQTHGFGTVLYDAGGSAVTIGDQVTLSDGTAGAVQQHDTLAVEQIVGYALHVPNANTDFIGVYLQLE